MCIRDRILPTNHRRKRSHVRAIRIVHETDSKRVPVKRILADRGWYSKTCLSVVMELHKKLILYIIVAEAMKIIDVEFASLCSTFYRG